MLNLYYCDFRSFTVETKPHWALLGNETVWLFIFLDSEGEVSVVAISQYKILRPWWVYSVGSPFLKWSSRRDLCSVIIRGKVQPRKNCLVLIEAYLVMYLFTPHLYYAFIHHSSRRNFIKCDLFLAFEICSLALLSRNCCQHLHQSLQDRINHILQLRSQ